MTNAWIVDAIRTPIGKYAGALSSVRPDDLAAIPIAALLQRNPSVDAAKVDDLILGCANQAGEDNRNVARMASLLAGLPVDVAAVTVNRLCGSGMNALGNAAHAIKAGDAELVIAGGVESMSRAPFVQAKPTYAFSRHVEMYDTTLGWRYPNPKMARRFDLIGMGETAENVANKFGITREEQDQFALESQHKAAAAWEQKLFADEIVPVDVPQRKGPAIVFDRDESPRPGTDMGEIPHHQET